MRRGRGYYKRYLEEAKPEPTVRRHDDRAYHRVLDQAGTEPPPPAEPPPAAAAPAEPPPEQPSRTKEHGSVARRRRLTFVTAGAVLAYSTKSAEQDLRDLYVSNDGEPPVFDGESQSATTI